jgi:uncharacterized protein (TIGR02145 family)
MIGVGLGVVAKRRYSGFPFALRSFWQRVRDDGGTMVDYNTVLDTYRALQNAGIDMDDIELLWNSDGGAVVRTDGILKFYRTGFGIGADLDGSATATVQPRLVGGIAPNSKYAASNQNGESRFFTHTPISFAANEVWSVTVGLNWNGSSLATTALISTRSADLRFIGLRSSNNNRFIFRDYASTQVVGTSGGTNQIIGKTTIITFVGLGTSLKIYINGTLYEDLTVANVQVDFLRIVNKAITDSATEGVLFYYRIQSGAMTAPQILSEATFLRTKYPEIESVVIGTKTIASRNFEAVASSNGTVIPQVSATASWVAGTSGWCYNNGNTTPDTAKPDNGAIYGKLYNKAARDVLVANPPSGWHVATEAELTALAALGGNALKFGGTDYWSTTGGTNATGFTALGSGNRNADGSFNVVKESSSFWCADSDKVLKVYHNNNTSEIIAADPKEGHSIRLIKN